LGEPNFLGILVAASHNTIFQVGLAMLEDLINQQWQALARLIRESRRLGQSKLKALIARKMRRRKPSLADAIGKRRKVDALDEYRRRFSAAAGDATPAPASLPATAQGFREPPQPPLERPQVLREPPRPRPPLEAPMPRPQLELLKPQQPLEAPEPQAAAEAPWVPAEASQVTAEPPQETPDPAPWAPAATPWVPAEAPRAPVEAPWVPIEAPWVPVEAPWVQAEAPKRQPQPELLSPRSPFAAPKPQPPLEAPKQRAPIAPSTLPERVQKAERQRRRIKAANQNKRQEPARPSRLSHRFNEALNSLPPSLAHDLSVLGQHKNEVMAAVAVCVIAFSGAYFYRSMTPDRKKPVQITHAAPPPRSEPEMTVGEKPKAPAVSNKKLYYDRLPPSEAAEFASEAPASPATAAIATAAPASLAEPPKETAPAAPEKTAGPAQAKVEAGQPSNTAPAASPAEPPKETALAAPEKTAEPAQAKAGANQPASAPATPALGVLEGQIADRPTWVRAEKYMPDGTRIDSLRPAPAPAAARLGDGEARKPVLAAVAPQPPAADQPAKRMDSAAAAPALTQAPAEPTAPAPGGYYAQVKSDQSRKAAEAELAVVVEKYKAVLGDLPLMTRSADLKDRGTWFRVLIGPVKSHDDADNLCKRLKGAGLQDCIVQKVD
jgi:hypothetical protein